MSQEQLAHCEGALGSSGVEGVEGPEADAAEQRLVEEASQLVPVGEAIRYRKRAQAAEQRVEALRGELEERARQQATAEARAEAAASQAELVERLARAGASDLEVALLLAEKRRASAGESCSAEQLVGQLRQERPELFGGGGVLPGVSLATPTAGARSGFAGRGNRLGQVADQVRRSGSRRDMQAYLRLRRSVQR